MSYGYQIAEPTANGGFGYATGEWYGGYPVRGDQTASEDPSTTPQVVDAPMLDFGQQPPDGSGSPMDTGGGNSPDTYGYPTGDQGQSLDPYGNPTGADPYGVGAGSDNAYDQYATEYQTPGGSPYGSADHVYTNADFSSGGGGQSSPTNSGYGGRIDNTPYGGATAAYSAASGASNNGQMAGSRGTLVANRGGNSGVQTPAPPLPPPAPFGSPAWRANAGPGDTGQPATGSKDTAFFMEQLRNLISNPGSITSSPAYKFAMEQGTQAMNRTAAARRGRFSGNALTEAQKFGQGLASTQYANNANVVGNALGRATTQYNADVGRYGLEQGLGQQLGVNNYAAWQNNQTNQGAQQANQILQQLAQLLNLG